VNCSPQASSSGNIFKDDDKENSRDPNNGRSQSHASQLSQSYSSSLSFNLNNQGAQERSQGVKSPSGQQARGHQEGERGVNDKSKDAAAQW